MVIIYSISEKTLRAYLVTEDHGIGCKTRQVHDQMVYMKSAYKIPFEVCYVQQYR